MMDCKNSLPTDEQAEQTSFRTKVKAQIQKLRRIQMICLPALFVAFIGLMLTAFLELNVFFSSVLYRAGTHRLPRRTQLLF